MSWLITKDLLTAAVVVIVSEAAKRSDKLGGFITALPLVTFLALICSWHSRCYCPASASG